MAPQIIPALPGAPPAVGDGCRSSPAARVQVSVFAADSDGRGLIVQLCDLTKLNNQHYVESLSWWNR